MNGESSWCRARRQRTPELTHREALAALGLTAGAARERLALYLDLVAEWNPRINLTGARDAVTRATLLVGGIPGWAARVQGPDVLDIGSGNGSPGLVLALLRPELHLTLLEPRARRWAFLREAIRRTGVRAEAVRARHAQYSGPAADSVVLRALQLGGRELWPLVRPGGLWIQIGAAPPSAVGFAPAPHWAADVHVHTRCFT